MDRLRLGALKAKVRATPVVGTALLRLLAMARVRRFQGSGAYWEDRYLKGGTSGSGSYRHLAAYKADVLNQLVADEHVASVLELGCGDGSQLSLASYPTYTGLDVSSTAIRMCMERFQDDPTKSFLLYDPGAFRNNGALCADLTLSLDVLYHLIEVDIFEMHLRHVFGASRRWVVIYAVDEDRPRIGAHVLHRRFTPWVGEAFPEWELVRHVPNPHPYDPASPDEGSLASFFIYRLRPGSA